MMTNSEFESAKRRKTEEISYIAAEIIALSILEERNFSAAESKKRPRFFMTRDNSGFGDKRRWCMKFIERESGKSEIFHLAGQGKPSDWVCAAMEKIPAILDKLEKISLRYFTESQNLKN